MAAGAAEPSAAERAAIFKAAGFKAKGDKYVRCEDDTTQSATPGRIEFEDVNGDSSAEAWVKKSLLLRQHRRVFCVAGKRCKSTWTIVLEDTGVPGALKTNSKGWPDIESGGPGFGKFP